MLTDDARARILELLDEFRSTCGKSAIPGIVWIDSDLNEGRIASGVGIGFYTNRAEVEPHIQTVNGLELVLALVEADRARFVGKTFDYQKGSFVLTDPN